MGRPRKKKLNGCFVESVRDAVPNNGILPVNNKDVLAVSKHFDEFPKFLQIYFKGAATNFNWKNGVLLHPRKRIAKTSRLLVRQFNYNHFLSGHTVHAQLYVFDQPTGYQGESVDMLFAIQKDLKSERRLLEKYHQWEHRHADGQGRRHLRFGLNFFPRHLGRRNSNWDHDLHNVFLCRMGFLCRSHGTRCFYTAAE